LFEFDNYEYIHIYGKIIDTLVLKYMVTFQPEDLDEYYRARRQPSSEISIKILSGNDTGNIELKELLAQLMTPIAEELHASLLGYGRNLNFCGFAAGILVDLLRRHLPNHKVKLGYGKQANRGMQHYWAEVDDVFIDAAYGQFNYRNARQILIGDIQNMKELKITRFDPEGDLEEQRSTFHEKLVDAFAQASDGVRVPGFPDIDHGEEEYTVRIVRELSSRLEGNIPDLVKKKPPF